MLRRALPLLALAACAQGPRARGARDDATSYVRSRPDLDAARELDQQGVRAFEGGRWFDATRYFAAAYRMGGPSSELWNVARSRERLDDAEGAAEAIDRYLGHRDLSPEDRAEAERELYALRTRASTLTVTTNPPGAVVTLDGRPAPGSTPLSIEIPAGAHTLAVRREGYAPAAQPLEARFGRAVIVSLDLARARR